MIKKVGIIGCGAMGAGIVQAVLEAGYFVVVREIDSSILEKGLAAVKKGIERSFEKKNMPLEAREEVFARLSGTVLIEDFRTCDLIIEAVFEDLRVKRELFSVKSLLTLGSSYRELLLFDRSKRKALQLPDSAESSKRLRRTF